MDSLDRLFVVLRALLDGLRLTRLAQRSEVLLVDWAGPAPALHSSAAFRERLCRAGIRAAFAACPSCRARMLGVTTEQAMRFAGNNNTISEVHAINVAARRTTAHWLLRLDGDTAPSQAALHLVGMVTRTSALAVGRGVLWAARRMCSQQFEYLRFLDDPADSPATALSAPAAREACGIDRLCSLDASGVEDNARFLAMGSGAVGIFGFDRKSYVALGGYCEDRVGHGHMEPELMRRLVAAGLPKLHFNQLLQRRRRDQTLQARQAERRRTATATSGRQNATATTSRLDANTTTGKGNGWRNANTTARAAANLDIVPFYHLYHRTRSKKVINPKTDRWKSCAHPNNAPGGAWGLRDESVLDVPIQPDVC